MPKSCCLLCHWPYLESDGSIDPKALREARKFLVRDLKEAGSVSLANYFSEPFTLERPPCLCECHKKGAKVHH